MESTVARTKDASYQLEDAYGQLCDIQETRDPAHVLKLAKKLKREWGKHIDLPDDLFDEGLLAAVDLHKKRYEQLDDAGLLGAHAALRRSVTEQIWSACVRTGSPNENSFRILSAEGEYRWFLSRVEALRASDGALLYWIGVNLDIDERKRAEEQLVKSGKERERELVAIVETVPSMLWSMSPTGEMIHLSERCLEYAGASFEEMLSYGWLSFIHPDDRDGTTEAFSRAIETGKSYNVIHRARRADGDYGRARQHRCGFEWNTSAFARHCLARAETANHSSCRSAVKSVAEKERR
jgi:PAS domain S-box-containing protein